jgi:very-short-patch-repair endonuclease
MPPVRRQISRHAAPLRRDATDVEKSLWSALRNRQIEGRKFRRQWTVGPYIADFACIEARLIVELDGGQHSPEADAARTRFLEAAGYRVIRFWNTDMVEQREGVLEIIRNALLEHSAEEGKTLTQPSPAKAGEG